MLPIVSEPPSDSLTNSSVVKVEGGPKVVPEKVMDAEIKTEVEEEIDQNLPPLVGSDAQGLKLREFATCVKTESPPKRQFKHSTGEKRLKSKVPIPLRTANVFGCEVKYKGSYNSIAFQLDTIFQVISKIIPTSTSISDVKLGHDEFIKAEGKGGFISLNYLKARINKHLYSQALKDMLNSYEPFEHAEVVSREPGTTGTLQRDHIKIFGMDVAFVVARGIVFFDILGAFTILGELGLPMRNKWEGVDSILLENGVTHRDAFRRYHKWTWTQRSHISLAALLILTEHGLVQNKTRRDTLLNLFRHIAKEVALVGSRKQQLFDALQALADTINDKTTEEVKVENNEDIPSLDVSAGTEECRDDFCGRQYHFTARCCAEAHLINVAGKSICYIVNGKDGQIFLEKCSAFSALGRMYVIRSSDYRKADKILSSSGMKIKEHYLYEKRRGASSEKPRRRRTHISFQAFVVLVNKGFAYLAKKEALLQGLDVVVEQMQTLKSACPNFEFKKSDEDLSTAQADPAVQEPEKQTKPQELVKTPNVINLLEKKVTVQNVEGKLHFLILDLMQFLPEEDGLTEKINNFGSKHHKEWRSSDGEQFVSAASFAELVEKNHVTPVNREVLLSELVSLVKNDNICAPATLKRKRKSRAGKKAASRAGSILSSKCKEPSVCIFDTLVPCKVSNDILYLEEKTICQICCTPNSAPLFRTCQKADRVIEEANICLDDAFLFDGRKRAHISTKALIVLIQNGVVGEEQDKEALLKRLRELESEPEKALLSSNRTLDLGPFGSVSYRSVENGVFLHTMQILTVVGFEVAADKGRQPDKIYPIICKLLRLRGLNQENCCFLKKGKSKYVFISLDAVLSLLQTKFGPFKNKEKMSIIRSLLLDSLKKQGFTKDGRRKAVDAEGGEANRPSCFKIGSGFPPIRYMAKDGELFVHRSTCFEIIGLEKTIMSGLRGFLPINEILQRRGLDLEQCYIAGDRERYSYISLVALLSLLESQDPIVNCLEKKERFSEALMTTLQTGVGRSLSYELRDHATSTLLTLECDPEQMIPFRLRGNRLYLSRQDVYARSGLNEKMGERCHGHYDIFHDPVAPLADRGIDASACFLEDGYGDPYAFVSVDALLVLMNLDGDISRAGDYNTLLWKNLLSAVIMEAPKLKVHVKTVEFRCSLLKTLMKKFIFFLEHREEMNEEIHFAKPAEESLSLPAFKKQRLCTRTSSSSSTDEESRLISTLAGGKAVAEDVAPEESAYLSSLENLLLRGEEVDLAVAKRSSISESSSSGGEFDYELSEHDFAATKENIMATQQNNYMSDWQVKACNDTLIHLAVAPGLSASRKLSFINPDVCAVLGYDLLLRPNSSAQLLINDNLVPGRFISDIVETSMDKGILNLLFNLLTLRPCFGSFSSELVETVQKGLAENSEVWQDVFIDKKFIGSGQNGRTYAGTVRSKKCCVLARTRVGDTCLECEALKHLVINRSVLSSSEDGAVSAAATVSKGGGDGSVGGGCHQKSVWQITETSSEGCTFVCPQLQSFNTSLPHQFSGSQQASTIVEHKVEISHDLKVRLLLNNSVITHSIIQKTFAEFEASKQVGPLLEWVASLRFCVGYPDPTLVRDAHYLLEKKSVLQPEIAKFFSHIFVDTNFVGKMTSSGGEFRGTVRTKTCRYLAGDHADICDQCLLLQEPIEFLGVNSMGRRK